MTNTQQAALDPSAEALPTFDVIPLSPAVRRAVDELGFTHPTPVQRACFEPAAAGRDMVVQARTGTGKTAAFGLPIVDRLVNTDSTATQILVLSPTRELALQISRQLEQLAAHKGLRVAAIYGGAAMQPQIDALRAGVHVVVGTPGRVLDHLERGTLQVDSIRTLVLDESDEMLSMGFMPQITAVLEQLPPKRQILLFSATVPPAVRRIAESRLRDPEFITLSGDHVGALSIQHYAYTVHGDKASELIQIIEIENPESAIVFCNTRDQTKRIASALQKRGFAADWLNADLSQSDRERVMQHTRESKLRFLVCTDVAARGIDISHLTHVINADFPESTENYVHRTGRTGRAGRTGTAISLIAPQDIGNLYMLRLTYKIFPIARELPSQREIETRREADLLEFLAAAFPRPQLSEDEIKLARRVLASEDAVTILAGLLRDHLGARPHSSEHAAEARREKVPAVPAPQKSRDSEPRRGRDGRRSEGHRSDERRSDDARRSDARRDESRRDHGADESRRDHGADPSREERRPAEHRSEERHSEERRTDDAREEDRAPAEGESSEKRDKKRKKKRKKRDGERREAHDREDRGESERDGADDAAPKDSSDRSDEGRAPRSSEASEPRLGEGLETISARELLRSDETIERIFVDVGRRDGAYREDFLEALEDRGFDVEDVRYVKIKDTHSFVGVPAELVDQALSSLDGATIAGCSARAERARRSSNSGDGASRGSSDD
ncbi:MAG TPA: DEAD/DEAH box helicase [Polyangiaceae bacterium]|nr:DEAD/DEAH box helicase [Polyangiaceae bacterium]